MQEAVEQMQDSELQDESRRAAFLLSLLAKRKEAVSGRATSGIEEEWLEDEEHYQGIDDANRAYMAATSRVQAKRWASGASSGSARPSRSIVFMNITAPYTDAASARVSDMLLPTDDRAWAIRPTPIPKLPDALVAELGGMEQAAEAVEAAREQAKASATAMQDEIDDCVTESNWHGEVRHVIEDAARIGSGVLKGPFPVRRAAKLYRSVNGVRQLVQVDEIKPGTKHIDPWDFYPDPACGESIHDGSYTFEREYVSARQLRDMMRMPGYDRAAIAAVLKEGPSRVCAEGVIRENVRSDEQFEMWIFYGVCDADDLEAVGLEVEDETPKASAMAVLVNDKLIKVALNVLDTGDFPYDVLAWQRRPAMPWGTGISRKIRTVQRVLNGAVRAMMDNSGVSAGPQVIIGNGVTPADGQFNIRGMKLWRSSEDIPDVRMAMASFVVPSVQAELMNIIQWAMQMAEDTTGMPAMLQGIKGDAPETLGGMQMQHNNASSVMRRLAKRFDDYLTRPHIRRYYDWMMQYSERADIKGDFQIDVRASSALVERDAQQQFLMGLLQASANPIYELDPAKLARELLKGQRYDPARVMFDQAKREQMQQQSNPETEAKAKLLAAQARKTEAEAVNKSVEGMFSATQAASNIALQPAVAPLADTLLRSAGFADMDAAPIIPEAQGVAAVPPVANTHPLTPANPAVGMDAGIEGGDGV